jgi:hypothetical protein
MPDPQGRQYLEPSDEAGRAFFARGLRGPVVMLNLLRFRRVADYSATPELAPSEPISGEEAYGRYIEHTRPFLGASGGEVRFLGKGGAVLIGPGEERWDVAMLVRQRSADAFLAFATNPGYLAGLGHRTAALEDSRLLPLVEASASDLVAGKAGESMFTKLSRSITGIASWPIVALLVVTLILCSLAFDWRQEVLGSKNKILDGRGWYTPAEARQLFKDLGDRGRNVYAATQVTLDLVFPVVYAFLFAILINRVSSGRRDWPVVVPLLAGVADLLENVTIAYLAWSYQGQESPLAWFAAICTLTKSLLFVASLVLILAGGVAGLRNPGGVA